MQSKYPIFYLWSIGDWYPLLCDNIIVIYKNSTEYNIIVVVDIYKQIDIPVCIYYIYILNIPVYYRYTLNLIYSYCRSFVIQQ